MIWQQANENLQECISSVEGIFYVTSPLQLICAAEARERFQIKDALLVTMYELDSPQRNARQIEALIRELRWTKVFRINYEQKSKFFDYLRVLKFILGLNYKHLFVGELSSFVRVLIANTRLEKVYLLDDGIATLAQRKEVANKNWDDQKKNLRKLYRDLRFSVFGYGLRYKHKLAYFSFIIREGIYGETIVTHSFEQLRDYFENFDDHVHEVREVCFFIGTGLENPCDPGSLALGRRVYEQATELLGPREEFTYLLHRSESADFMRAFLPPDHYRIESWDFPLEFEFIRRRITPKLVTGTISTGLISLKLLFPDARVVALKIPGEEAGGAMLDDVWDCFQRFKIELLPLKPKGSANAQ